MKRNVFRISFSGLFVALFILLCGGLGSTVLGAEEEQSKWGGVDESVVEKYAKEHGREAREPFINTDQGDLLLFVFLLGGAAGGFLAGYSWRNLLERRTDGRDACAGSKVSRPAAE